MFRNASHGSEASTACLFFSLNELLLQLHKYSLPWFLCAKYQYWLGYCCVTLVYLRGHLCVFFSLL